MAGTAEQFVVVADAALVLDYGLVTQAVVKGLNKMKMYGLTRDRIEVQEFRQAISRAFNGGMKMSDMEFGGSLILGDKLGQSTAKKRMIDNTTSTGDRFYLNFIDRSLLKSDFVACDLANDPITNGWQVSKFDTPQVGVNAVQEFDSSLSLNGRPALFDTHYTASMAITKGTGSTPDTITDAANGFVTAGFYVGQTIIIEGTGSGANDGDQYTIGVLAIGVMTLYALSTSTATQAASIGNTTAVTPAASFTLHGGAL